jgi:hypothetical protein
MAVTKIFGFFDRSVLLCVGRSVGARRWYRRLQLCCTFVWTELCDAMADFGLEENNNSDLFRNILVEVSISLILLFLSK